MTRVRKRGQLAVKHGLDRAFAALALAVLSPVFAGIAAAIKLEDGGPVFFRQARAGRGQAKFYVWKFRTMRVDADRLLDSQGRPTGARVTRVGYWLRWTSLDELPQILNILAGDMSVVGPRPVIPGQGRRFKRPQRRRFAVKPGITGLAQIKGRNFLKWSERLAYDRLYVQRVSLALDAYILLRTVKVVLKREGVAMDRNPGDVDDLPPDPGPSDREAS